MSVTVIIITRLHVQHFIVSIDSQLFGEPDADEDVSPDTEDPEATGSSSEIYQSISETHQSVHRISTREWVSSCSYHPDKLFQKVWICIMNCTSATTCYVKQFFVDDINYLLTMDKLWQTRRAPVPLDDQSIPIEGLT